MSNFNDVLTDAQKLPVEDQLRLIDALWDSVPPDAALPLHDDWGPELERRVDAIKSGNAVTIPWDKVRAEALARIGHATTD